MARGSGIKRDLRLVKYNCYSGYNLVNLKGFCGINGDSYDRYMIRMLEMGESLNVVNYVSEALLSRYFKSDKLQITSLNVNKIFNKSKDSSYSSMEELIEHFVN